MAEKTKPSLKTIQATVDQIADTQADATTTLLSVIDLLQEIAAELRTLRQLTSDTQIAALNAQD